jgi:hypothetical protein
MIDLEEIPLRREADDSKGLHSEVTVVTRN